jgi:hypothetical protein
MKNPILSVVMLFLLLSFVKGESGVSYDLTPAVSSIIGSSPISILVADNENSIVYFGTTDGKIGYYNETSNTSVDLTPLVSAWVGANYIYSGTVDSQHHRFYFTAGQIMNLWGYISVSENSATQLVPTWWYMTSLKYDKESHVIWYATNNNEFGYINTSTNSVNIITTSGFGDICIDYQDERVYVVSNNGVAPPFYYDKNTASIVSLTSIPFYTLGSCDIDTVNHIIYMGRCESFQSAGYYFPDNDTWVTSYWNGDSVCDFVTRYLPRSNLVGVMQSGVYGSLYNISDNSTINLLTTEEGTWMDLGYSGMAGDYMNTSLRLYMGFSDGAFGYYNDNPAGPCTENWIAYNGSCQYNDTAIKYYLDNNSCGTYFYLPGDNGTETPCNYCAEDLVQVPGGICTPNGTENFTWSDNNYYSCCIITGLPSDCDILVSPYNETGVMGCNLTASDFEIDLDSIVYYGYGNDKVSGHIWLNDTVSNYSCITYVKTITGGLIQTNPAHTQFTTGVLNREIEDREFFIPNYGIASVYWTKENLIIDGRQYIFGVECAGGGSKKTSEAIVTVLYENVNAPVTRYFWVGENIVPLIIGLIFIIAIAILIGYLYKKVKYG